MTTARALRRDAVVTLLKRGVPAVKGRVHKARTWSLQERELPLLLVYAWDETKTAKSLSTVSTQYGVALTLAVEVRVAQEGRASEAVEQDLEDLAGAVCEAVLKAPELLGDDGLLERILGVKTTFGVDARESEVALGRALIAFEFQWSEVYDLPLPPTDCESAALAFAPRFSALP